MGQLEQIDCTIVTQAVPAHGDTKDTTGDNTKSTTQHFMARQPVARQAAHLWLPWCCTFSRGTSANFILGFCRHTQVHYHFVCLQIGTWHTCRP
jgi:hypothetical protein